MAVTENTPRTLDCGKTIEELSGYLAADRVPFDSRIETCPECLNALQGLDRISQLSRDLIAQDIADLPAPPENWMQDIMTNIQNEVRTGRVLPLNHPDPRVSLSITEGAVRALIRAVGDEVPAIVIGKCQLRGEVEIPGAPIDVTVSASVAWGEAIPNSAQTVRRLVYEALADHTQLNVVSVNVVVENLHGYDLKPNKEKP